MILYITMKEYSEGNLLDGLIFQNEEDAQEHPKSLIYFLLRNYKIPQDVIEAIEHLDSIEAHLDEFIAVADAFLKEHNDCILDLPLPNPITLISMEK